jgi:hypothetical protein
MLVSMDIVLKLMVEKGAADLYIQQAFSFIQTGQKKRRHENNAVVSV